MVSRLFARCSSDSVDDRESHASIEAITPAVGPQFRLNRFLTSCPEIISVKDNRVSGTVVAELPLATVGMLLNGG